MPAVKNHQPSKIVELIQTVEKALQDLCDLGDTGAIKNPLVTKSIESKLPDTLKKEWLVHAADGQNKVVPGNRFDNLLAFLKKQEAIYEQLEHLKEEEPKRDARAKPRHARTRATKSSDEPTGCVVCGDIKHKRKLFFCKKFQALKPAEKGAAVKKLGACERCLEVHDSQAFCKPTYLCRQSDCKDGRRPEHHYFLCSNAAARTTAALRRKDNLKAGRKGCTAEQEDFISSLPTELAVRCRDVFSNSASRTLNTTREPSSLLMQHGLRELPVIMMLLQVTANAGQQIGTLIDLASDTNYITHKAADRLNLHSEEMTLVVHGVGGMKVHVQTKRYLLKIRVKTSKGSLQSHQLVCYGLDNIADIQCGVTAEQLHRLFPDVLIRELTRPKEIDLLISHREGKLAPQ
ncbi:uncharacterized protein LOC132886504 [Neoarius graeffei]|uniref:uncharacterized protein LOC132886504 n=1 Tax=Neoarius graeffei TaxID=443677 RepID=UPI00298C87D6|nr:uncharacterized protein LOC132886504 [Neoarius graeffei]